MQAQIEIYGEDPYGPEGEGIRLPHLIFLARSLGVVWVFGLWLVVEHFGLERPLVLVGGGLLFLGIAIVFDGPMRRRACRQGRAVFLNQVLLLRKEHARWELPAPEIDGFSVQPDWIQLYVDGDLRPRPSLAVPTPARSTQRRVVRWLEERAIRRIN